MNRYSRQVLLSQIGEEGQTRLQKSKVTIIGCGALGTGIAEHLTRAGVGDIVVVDRDFIELDNLQRQHLFTEADVGTPKAVTAHKKLNAINTEVTITGVVEDVNQTNVESFIKGRDIILDGTDNLNVRYIVNDACNKIQIPWVYGACISVNGMTMNILPEGPCLQCLLPQMPAPGSVPSCDTVGIINTLPSVVSSIQSTEALKFLTGAPIMSDLTIIDIWDKDFKTVAVSQREDCPCCVNHFYQFMESPETVTVLCGRDAVQVNPSRGSVPLEDLAERLAPLGTVQHTPYILFFSVDQYTLSIFPDGRAIIKGTSDRKKAKTLYATYVGI
jgi:adenylyltransferase/sulfurtransferase